MRKRDTKITSIFQYIGNVPSRCRWDIHNYLNIKRVKTTKRPGQIECENRTFASSTTLMLTSERAINNWFEWFAQMHIISPNITHLSPNFVFPRRNKKVGVNFGSRHVAFNTALCSHQLSCHAASASIPVFPGSHFAARKAIERSFTVSGDVTYKSKSKFAVADETELFNMYCPWAKQLCHPVIQLTVLLDHTHTTHMTSCKLKTS